MEEPPLLGNELSLKDDGISYLQSKKIQIAEKDLFIPFTFRRTGDLDERLVPTKWKWRIWFLKAILDRHLHPSLHVAMATAWTKDVEVIFLGGKATSWGPNLPGREERWSIMLASVASRSVHFGHWLFKIRFWPDGIWLGGEFRWSKADDSRQRKKTVILSVSDETFIRIKKYKTCDLQRCNTAGHRIRS